MTDRSIPTLAKWPFFLGDAVLLGFAWWLMTQTAHPLGLLPQALLVACVGAGAWLAVIPFLKEFDARLKFSEADNLASVVAKIDRLDLVGEQIQNATSQWQAVQERAGKTVEAVREMEERMTVEAKSFADFMQKSNDNEKSHLRLEVDKLRRAEGDWLSINIRLLDHVYALYRAAVRSGQRELVDQIGRFQFACYDTARRIGVVATEAVVGDPFHPEQHQMPNPDDKPGEGAVVEDTLATGYSFQGQVLRLPVVVVKYPAAPVPEVAPESVQDTPPAGEELVTETPESPAASEIPASTTATLATEPDPALLGETEIAPEPEPKRESPAAVVPGPEPASVTPAPPVTAPRARAARPSAQKEFLLDPQG